MIIHASAVAIGGRGLLILGPSGAGKSVLALALMGMGAELVADDRVVLHAEGDRLMADSPPALRGRIEARHVGILGAAACGPVPLALGVDLGGPLPARLPQWQLRAWLGLGLKVLRTQPAPALAPALRQALIGGVEP